MASRRSRVGIPHPMSRRSRIVQPTQQQRRNPKPPSQRCRRPLTPPPPPSPFRPLTRSLQQKQIRYQAHCGLLTKLAVEIRLMIWELAIGGLNLYIIERDKTLRRLVDTNSRGRLCRSTLFPPQWSLLPLLRTCRQVYSEAISILYTSNVFVLMNPMTIQILKTSILPSRWDIIRSLEVYCAWGGALWSSWENICRTVKMLRGLQHFTLISKESGPARYPNGMGMMLEPLKELRLKGPWGLKIRGAEEELAVVDATLKGAGFDCHVTPSGR